MFDAYKRLSSAIGERYGLFARLKKTGRVVVGHGTYGAPNIEKYDDDDTKLSIGAYCSIASTATFVLGGNHPTDRLTTFPFRLRFGLAELTHDGFPSSKGDIVVGNDVWIAHEALVLSGVRIHNGAVVAARAVVTKDVPAFSIVAGNPARVVGYRAAKEYEQDLEEIGWWYWDRSTVIHQAKDLSTMNFADFVQIYNRADARPRAGG